MKEQPAAATTLPDHSVDIIDVIRKLRNDLIKDFLDERNMIEYLSRQFKIMELSAIRMEFIKSDLKKLLITPVDITWYKPVIDEFERSGSAALTEGNEKLFYKEIEEILKRYLFS